MQQSQTDYADMVDESGEGGAITLSKIPTSLHTKPLHVDPGMHHMEKLDYDSLSDEEIKESGLPNLGPGVTGGSADKKG